jgi:hypothetical protein
MPPLIIDYFAIIIFHADYITLAAIIFAIDAIIILYIADYYIISLISFRLRLLI